jgi:hypothetical protein
MSTVIDGSAGVTTNAGGSVNPSTNVEGINYSCRAWVNFNGTGTVAIRESGNVSSITDNGVGLYTVNFTTAMSDINYSTVVVASPIYASGSSFVNLYSNSATTEVAPTTSAFTLRCGYSSAGTTEDLKYISVAIFR